LQYLESDAIRDTFGENCRIQLCLFHVAQCWSRNLATKIKKSPGQHSNAKVVRGNITSDLQLIIYETSCETLVEKVRIFREKWTAEQPQFVEYLENRWLD
jgi:transposase-like protein